MSRRIAALYDTTPPNELDSENNSIQLTLEIPKISSEIARYCDSGNASVCTLKHRRHPDAPCTPPVPHFNVVNDFDATQEDPFLPRREVWNVLESQLRTAYLQNIAVLTLTDSCIPVVNFRIDPKFQAAFPNLETLTLSACTLYCRREDVSQPPLQEAQTSTWKKLKFVYLENVEFRDHPSEPQKTSRGKLIQECPYLGEVSVRVSHEGNDVILKAWGRSAMKNFWLFEAPKLPRPLNCSLDQFSTVRLRLYTGLPIVLDEWYYKGVFLDQLLVHYPSIVGFPSIPRSSSCDNLTKLGLFGKFSENLDFLNQLSQLRELSWNNHRKKPNNSDSASSDNCLEILRWQPVDCTDIVQKTTGLVEGFRLKHLHTLELEWMSDSLECWEKLASWTPGVKNLTCTVLGDEQLRLIGNQWKELERLKMGHGSRASSREIAKFMLDHKNMQSVISIPCPCIKSDDENVQLVGNVDPKVLKDNDLKSL